MVNYVNQIGRLVYWLDIGNQDRLIYLSVRKVSIMIDGKVT